MARFGGGFKMVFRFGLLLSFLVPPFAAAPPVLAEPPRQETSLTSACARAWNIAGNPRVQPLNGTLHDVSAVAGDNVYAVGAAGEAPTTTALVEHWDGTRWSVVLLPTIPGAAELFGIDSSDANTIWAVGNAAGTSLVLRWDGVSWNQVSVPDIGPLEAVKVFAANDVWAVGSAILHWDGGQWTTTDLPTTGIVDGRLMDIDGLAPNDVWAVGYQDFDPSSHTQTRAIWIFHYNGSTWAPDSYEVHGKTSELLGVHVLPANGSTPARVFAAGSYWASGFGTKSLILVNDGSEWALQSLPDRHDRIASNRLYDITAVQPKATYAMAVGIDADPGGEGLAYSMDTQGWTSDALPKLHRVTILFDGIDGVSAVDNWAVGHLWSRNRNTVWIERYAVSLAKPSLRLPFKGSSLAERRVQLDWTDVDCANRFEVAVYQDTRHGALVAAANDLKTSEYQTQPLAKGHTYWWHARACRGSVCSVRSEWRKFTIH